jgi:uncharacterized protein with von Willebrand factor type A (vWA) domain
MTKPHRATPEQWESIELYAEDNAYDACFLELRARIEALELTHHAHVDTSHLTDAERKQIREELARPATFAELLMPPPRTALAQPEPQGLSDKEAVALYSEVMAVHECQTLGDMAGHFARAVLARYGTPAINTSQED